MTQVRLWNYITIWSSLTSILLCSKEYVGFVDPSEDDRLYLSYKNTVHAGSIYYVIFLSSVCASLLTQPHPA